jgi:hypothetical protein
MLSRQVIAGGVMAAGVSVAMFAGAGVASATPANQWHPGCHCWQPGAVVSTFSTNVSGSIKVGPILSGNTVKVGLLNGSFNGNLSNNLLNTGKNSFNTTTTTVKTVTNTTTKNSGNTTTNTTTNGGKPSGGGDR